MGLAAWSYFIDGPLNQPAESTAYVPPDEIMSDTANNAVGMLLSLPIAILATTLSFVFVLLVIKIYMYFRKQRTTS